jgi:hypothetical protein
VAGRSETNTIENAFFVVHNSKQFNERSDLWHHHQIQLVFTNGGFIELDYHLHGFHDRLRNKVLPVKN